ncbi:MAG TPA: hypothetical protein VFP58_14120 [Candidatus Eisenbacteria bacterium]|nr:hypothetical protein [Candidatus Eisenbacteria bacterium]
MAASAGQYVQVVGFRVVLAVAAILIAARAGHQGAGSGPVWLLASMLAIGGAACLLWPLIVPARHRAMSVYTVGPAFFLAGMFLLPPAPLVVAIAFAVALAGILQGTRAYRVVFQLSSSIVVFGGFALALDLGPRASDFMFQPAPRAGLEFLISAAALVALLIVRSVAIRLEQGEEAPHWGAFQGPALVEGLLCLVFASTILVLGRIHLAFLGVVAVEIAMIWWFLNRYKDYAEERRTMPEAGVERRRARPARAAGPATITPLRHLGREELGALAAGIAREAPAGANGSVEDDDEGDEEKPWRSERSRRLR